MKNKQKGFAALLLITIVAILIIVGGFYYSKKSSSSKIQSGSQTTPTYAPDAYLGWKVYMYTSTSSNYAIKYPPTWYVATSTDGSMAISNYSDSFMNNYYAQNGDLAQPDDYFSITLRLTQVDQTLSIENYLKSINSQPTISEKITLNGVSGIKNTYLNNVGIGGDTKANTTLFILKQNNEIAEIRYGFDDSVTPLISTADKIINSLTLSVK